MTLAVRSIGGLALAFAACSGLADVSASAAPQVNCGAAGLDPDGQQLQLIVVHGSIDCAEAMQVLTQYRADSEKQGSGGFASVGDWECAAHNSVAGYEQSHPFDTCTRGTDEFGTQAATR